MGEIIRYGAYLPQYRAPLGEIQKFYGRPGRPRAKALCTPALDEDALTMAYEASVRSRLPITTDFAPVSTLVVLKSTSSCRWSIAHRPFRFDHLS